MRSPYQRSTFFVMSTVCLLFPLLCVSLLMRACATPESNAPSNDLVKEARFPCRDGKRELVVTQHCGGGAWGHADSRFSLCKAGATIDDDLASRRTTQVVGVSNVRWDSSTLAYVYCGQLSESQLRSFSLAGVQFHLVERP